MSGSVVEQFESYEELAGLHDGWQALCDTCPWATPFQRPDWLLPWVRHFGPREPWIICASAGVDTGNHLLGLALLFRYQRAGQNVLACLGAGISDYLDVLVEPGHERVVLPAMLARLQAQCAHVPVDSCELDEIGPDSPLLRALPPGWTAHAEPQSLCPALMLPGKLSELDTCVPRSHLKRFHQYKRRAEREGALRFTRATAENRDMLLDALFRLHEARWRDRGEPGVLDAPIMRAFHHEAAAAFSVRHALALYGLWLNDRVIACLYGFVEKDTTYYYLSGFEPGLRHLSPGVLVIGLAIEDGIQQGLRRFDFLRGSEPYKYWWGARDRPTMRVCLRWPGMRHAATLSEHRLDAIPTSVLQAGIRE